MRSRLDHPLFISGLGALGLLFTVLAGPARQESPSASKPPNGGGVAGDSRDRNATKPTDIPGRGWWEIIKRVVAQVSTDRLLTEAAGVTFFALLAIFPALAALISLYGLFADPRTVANHLTSLEGVMPGGGMDILKEQVC